VPQVTQVKVFWMMHVDVVVIMGIGVEFFQRCWKSDHLDYTEQWPLNGLLLLLLFTSVYFCVDGRLLRQQHCK